MDPTLFSPDDAEPLALGAKHIGTTLNIIIITGFRNRLKINKAAHSPETDQEACHHENKITFQINSQMGGLSKDFYVSHFKNKEQSHVFYLTVHVKSRFITILNIKKQQHEITRLRGVQILRRSSKQY